MTRASPVLGRYGITLSAEDDPCFFSIGPVWDHAPLLASEFTRE